MQQQTKPVVLIDQEHSGKILELCCLAAKRAGWTDYTIDRWMEEMQQLKHQGKLDEVAQKIVASFKVVPLGTATHHEVRGRVS